ncbi:MAG: alginate lyase family protein [Saprospiraceae bacterium]|nr:alginate lyase family protein [Saprospiraceae bacterium]
MRPLLSVLLTLAFSVVIAPPTFGQGHYYQSVIDVLRDSIILLANQNLASEPITVSSALCERSSGGRHDFYSEGDYWWPDPNNPDGPYIRKDGITNPENFTEHRKALLRFSALTGNLTSAFIITKDAKYAQTALKHIHAWFVDPTTKMNPHLLYAQAIKGRQTGRGIGIIDAIHFMEVVQSLRVLDHYQQVEEEALAEIKAWFGAFIEWLTTHPYGQKEMIHPNNHGTCWNMQVASYARFTQNEEMLEFCRNNYTQTLLPNQMAADGSFPLEMERTKPYGYALFNLDAMAMNCQILSDNEHNLWNFETEDGRGIAQGLAYMYPFVIDKKSWQLDPDVMYWDDWPVAHPAFLFGAMQFDRAGYFLAWQKHRHFLKVQEVRRNVPIRNPLIWLAIEN